MKIISIFTTFVLLLVAQPILAHSGGFTYETTTGDYFIDIGSNRAEFLTKELSLFEYNIYHNSDPNNLANFDSVFVTISDGEQVLVSTYVHRPELLLTVLSYNFQKAGEYRMSARFIRGSEKLAEVEFPITVGEGEGASNLLVKIAILTSLAGLVVGYGLSYLVKKA